MFLVFLLIRYDQKARCLLFQYFTVATSNKFASCEGVEGEASSALQKHSLPLWKQEDLTELASNPLTSTTQQSKPTTSIELI